MWGDPPNWEEGKENEKEESEEVEWEVVGENYIQPPRMDVDGFLKEVVEPMIENDKEANEVLA